MGKERKKKGEGAFPKIFEASITLIQKSDKDTTHMKL